MLRLWVSAVIVWAAQFGFSTDGWSDPIADQTWKECRSGDQDVRFVGCSKIIAAKGYGDRKQFADALDGRCWALHAMQKFQEAIVDCKAALALNPKHAYALNNLGTALLGLREISSAIGAFDASIATNPRFARPYIKRGQAYQALGRRDLAMQDYQRALQLNNNNGEVLAAIQALQVQPPLAVQHTPHTPPSPKEPNDSVDRGWGFITTTSQSSPSVRRRAILIANDEYRRIEKLAGPQNDIQATSSVLKDIGFETVLLRNPSRGEIISAISSANFNKERGSLLLLYYSGHAAEINGENTILLTGFDPARGIDAAQSIPLKTLLDALAEADFDKTLVAFDACRNPVKLATVAPVEDGPRAGGAIRSVRGMKLSQVELQSLRRKEYSILFSTSVGDFAIDSLSDGLSPFTKSFTSALRRESSFIPAMVLTKRITEELTSNEQSPTIEIKWNSDLTFSRTLRSSNSAFYELNEPLKFTGRRDAQFALLNSMTEKKWYGGSLRTILALKDNELRDCIASAAFVWTSSLSRLGYCALPQLGFTSSDTSALSFISSESVYNSGSYFGAEWNVDLDFDGKPETFRAERRNADYAFIVKSRTQEFEFRGLVGSNIGFLGAHDFNKDGVLDLFIEIDASEGFFGAELIVLDGKTIVSGLQKVQNCSRTDGVVCRRELTIASQMKGSIFGHHLKENYYSHDIFQIILFDDWNIKHWDLRDDGRLDYVTYGRTWQNEKSMDEDYQIAKSVMFNKGDQKFAVGYDGLLPRMSVKPLLESIKSELEVRSFPN